MHSVPERIAVGRPAGVSFASPVLVVVEQVARQQPFDMPLIQDDHVVKQVAAND